MSASAGCIPQPQQWCRTVIRRQGRFLIATVTVRPVDLLPLRTVLCKVYTAGRFTVREELQWLGKQPTQQQLGRAGTKAVHLRLAARLHLEAVQQSERQLGGRVAVEAAMLAVPMHDSCRILSGQEQAKEQGLEQHQQQEQEQQRGQLQGKREECGSEEQQQQQAGKNVAEMQSQQRPRWLWWTSSARQVCM